MAPQRCFAHLHPRLLLCVSAGAAVRGALRTDAAPMPAPPSGAEMEALVVQARRWGLRPAPPAGGSSQRFLVSSRLFRRMASGWTNRCVESTSHVEQAKPGHSVKAVKIRDEPVNSVNINDVHTVRPLLVGGRRVWCRSNGHFIRHAGGAVDEPSALASVLHEACWSPRQLGGAINAWLERRGRRAERISPTTPCPWARRGSCPREPYPSVAAAVLSERLGRRVSAADLWPSTPRVRHTAPVEAAAGLDDAADTSTTMALLSELVAANGRQHSVAPATGTDLAAATFHGLRVAAETVHHVGGRERVWTWSRPPAANAP